MVVEEAAADQTRDLEGREEPQCRAVLAEPAMRPAIPLPPVLSLAAGVAVRRPQIPVPVATDRQFLYRGNEGTMKTTLLILIALLVSLPVLYAQERALDPADRLQVREAQLAMSQAHIAFLQAQIEAARQEGQLSSLLERLKTKYACTGCQLSSDLSWIKPPAPAKPEPAGKSSDSKKEGVPK
jgi:hypothetical protein